MSEGPGFRAQGPEGKLPVHGFVLAGGKSSRMGRDKATLPFRGRPMVEIAVEKLRGFCAQVSICGNRDDLAGYAPVVHEERVDAGPAAGIEAGLKECEQPWAMFVPVDVPLVPGELLRSWAEEALRQAGRGPLVADHLFEAVAQPVFCMIRADRYAFWRKALESGERRLTTLFRELDGGDGYTWHTDAYEIYGDAEPEATLAERWFVNVNTPEELRAAEAWASEHGGC